MQNVEPLHKLNHAELIDIINNYMNTNFVFPGYLAIEIGVSTHAIKAFLNRQFLFVPIKSILLIYKFFNFEPKHLVEVEKIQNRLKKEADSKKKKLTKQQKENNIVASRRRAIENVQKYDEFGYPI
jgi:hypothetical protein